MIWTPDPTLPMAAFANHEDVHVAGRWAQDREELYRSLGTGWQTYGGLVVRQSGVVAATVTCQYRRFLGSIDMVYRFILTGTGTAANAVFIEGLPGGDIHASWVAFDAVVGVGSFLERSGSSLDWTPVEIFADTATQLAMRNPNNGGASGARIGTHGFTGALQSGDVITGRASWRPAV